MDEALELEDIDAAYCLLFLREVRDAAFATVDEEGLPAVRVIYYYIYQQLTFLKMGYASAVAMLLVCVLGVLTAIQLRLMRAGTSDLA